MKLCLPLRSDCAKVTPAPCLFPCVPGARSADFSHKIRLSQPLPPINPASLPQEERTGFSLLCISRIIQQLGFMLTTGGLWEPGRKLSWLMESVGSLHGERQKYSVLPACDHGGKASPTAGSGRLLGFQSQVLLEPLYRQIIFAQGVLLLQGDSPVCRGKDLMHTGGLKNPPWPNCHLSAGPHTTQWVSLTLCCSPRHGVQQLLFSHLAALG